MNAMESTRERLELLGIIAALEAELSIEQKENRRLRERLKCCGNCVQYGDWGEDTPCGADIGLAIKALPAYRPPLHCEPSDPCHFAPSRWTEKR